jgi:hypothetical protein
MISAAEEQALRDLVGRDGAWAGGDDPCSWPGVTCEDVPGGGPARRAIVTRLVLRDRGLGGALPREIGLLTDLVHLDLSGNRLRGRLPPQLGHLRNLVHLDLSRNRLRGEIPARLRLLHRLQTLDLHGNRLSGEIPGVLGDLRRLAVLDLSHNRFEGPLPADLARLRSLRRLSVEGNDLRGTLPPVLTRLTALEHFSFDRTGLAEPGDPAFQAWLAEIDDLARTDVLHAEVAAPGHPVLAALTGLGATGAVLTSAGLIVLPLLGPVAGALFALGGTTGAGLLAKRVYDLPALRGPAPGGEPPPLSGPNPRDEALRVALIQDLRVIVDVAEGELDDPEIVDRLTALESLLLDLLARVEHLSGGDPDVYTLRQTVRDYLPEALASYRALPPAYAAKAQLPGSGDARSGATRQTARAALLRQLELLHQAAAEIAERLPAQEAQRLLRHGRFLEGKFAHRGDDEELEL